MSMYHAAQMLNAAQDGGGGGEPCALHTSLLSCNDSFTICVICLTTNI